LNSEIERDLDENRVDSLVSLAKGIVGALPVAGPLFSEVIGAVIPNQRADRIVGFLHELDKRLSLLEGVSPLNKYSVDLFEDTLQQASRALSEDRNRTLANYFSKSINVDEDEYETKKKILQVLAELTDVDIEILGKIDRQGYQSTARDYYPGHLTQGQYDRLNDDQKYKFKLEQVSFDTHIFTLERNRLIEAERQEQDEDNTQRHIDPETGLPKILSYGVSKFGEVLLYSIR
jgi:DNA-binding transcriptional ArsR family regulator